MCFIPNVKDKRACSRVYPYCETLNSNSPSDDDTMSKAQSA